MGDTVTMTHPDIDGEIEVHPRGVRVREKTGWKVKGARKATAKKPPKSTPDEGDKTATSGTDAAEAASNKED
jgi:hypothetical protein